MVNTNGKLNPNTIIEKKTLELPEECSRCGVEARPTESWEERYSKKFSLYSTFFNADEPIYTEVRAFIHQLLTEERQSQTLDIREKIKATERIERVLSALEEKS